MLKKISFVLGLLVIAGTFQTAAAVSLEDVLKEKGIITEADYKEIVKSSPVKYKLGDGFKFSSPDGKYNGTIGGMLQSRYTYTGLDGANDGAKTGQDSSMFEIKRVKLWLMGDAYLKDITYKVQMHISNIKTGKISNGGLLEDTFINYRLLDELNFRFGQTKVRFGRQGLVSSPVVQLVDKSMVTDAFFPGYDTGLMLHGKIAGGIINYNVNVAGGVGQNTFRATTNNAFNARLTVDPLGEMKYTESDVEHSEKPLVSFGADYYLNKLSSTEMVFDDKNGNQLGFLKPGAGWFAIGNGISPAASQIKAESVDFNMLSIDAAFKWQGFFVQSEYMYGEASGQTTHNKLISHGFYGQAGYFVIPKKLELNYRYSYLDPNRSVANDHWVENTAGICWYISQHNLKLGVDFANIHKQSAIASTPGVNATDDKQIRVQAQIVF